MTNTVPELPADVEKRFDESLVEMSLLMARDMNNRPPLYDVPLVKIDEIKQFIATELEQARKEERELIKNIVYGVFSEFNSNDKVNPSLALAATIELAFQKYEALTPPTK